MTNRAVLLAVGTLLGLFAAFHLLVTYEHWRQVGSGRESVLGPAAVAVVSAVAAAWVIRRARRRPVP